MPLSHFHGNLLDLLKRALEMWSKVLSLHCVFFLKTGETGRLETHVSVAEAMPERPRGRATRKKQPSQ